MTTVAYVLSCESAKIFLQFFSALALFTSSNHLKNFVDGHCFKNKWGEIGWRGNHVPFSADKFLSYLCCRSASSKALQHHIFYFPSFHSHMYASDDRVSREALWDQRRKMIWGEHEGQWWVPCIYKASMFNPQYHKAKPGTKKRKEGRNEGKKEGRKNKYYL